MPKSDDDGLLDVSGLELLFNFMQVQFLCVLIWQGKQGFKVGTTQRGIRKEFSVNCDAFLQNEKVDLSCQIFKIPRKY